MTSSRTSAFLAALLFHLCFFLPVAAAQQPEQELVANLAAGRVVIYVARDGIAIGAVETRVEAEARPPAFVTLSGRRIAVLLGAVEWVTPAGGPPLRLDRELPKLAGQVTGAKRLQQEKESDLEQIGLALLEPLRAVAQKFHRKLDLGPDEPLVQLLIVGYVPEYGPEVWVLRYRVVQEPLRGDYWRTRVLRPSYHQLYPPEKGQPRTLVEVRYPPDSPGPAFLEALRSDAARWTALQTSDAQILRAAKSLEAGETHKAFIADATQFLHAALNATAPAGAAVILAAIHEQRGLQWVLAPPEPPERAEKERAEEEKREPGAPSLRKKP